MSYYVIINLIFILFMYISILLYAILMGSNLKNFDFRGETTISYCEDGKKSKFFRNKWPVYYIIFF